MKRILSISIVVILVLALSLPVFAGQSRVADNAGLLTEWEAEVLSAELDTISDQWSMDFVVVTTDSLEGKSAQAYADDYFDENGYGMGADYSGVLLLLSMEDRDWAISTCGQAISTFTDYDQKQMMDTVLPYLSEGAYYEGFSAFATGCSEICQAEAEGDSFPFFVYLLISLVLGFIVALIATGVMKGKLKSVRAQAAANNYLKQDSLQVTEARDLFLYRTVTRQPKPKPTSSTHTSSSGRTHGGSSGKF